MDKPVRSAKTKLVMLFAAVIVIAVAVVSTTFAWLEISRTPIVSDLELTVMAESYLEVAPDENGLPGEWDVSLDLSVLLNDMAPLRPVTYSKENRVLYTTLYDVDGRNTGKAVALSDEVNANVKVTGTPSANENGYYIAVPFWVRSAQNATISLSKAQTVKDDTAGSGTYVIGNPIWDGQALEHKNGGNGLETAIRIGFNCQPTDSNGRSIGDSTFTIYEPNCDTHVTAENGYIETTSLDSGALIDDSALIKQTTSEWNETNPVLEDSLVYNLGDFEGKSDLFALKIGNMQKVTMYIWLEGRDIDCINVASAATTSILARIQLTANDGYVDTGIVRD